MNPMEFDREEEVCAFVREIIAARTGEDVTLVGRPDKEERNLEAVEQIWTSASHAYAVEHTRIEAFDGQIRLEENVKKLLIPLRQAHEGKIPGDFRIVVREQDLRSLRVSQYDSIRAELESLIQRAAPTLAIGSEATLASEALPFTAKLVRRDWSARRLLIYTDVELGGSDEESVRLERLRRALAKKSPKLAREASKGLRSVLILDSTDEQHSSALVICPVLRQALAEREDNPHTVVLVETYCSPFTAHVRKEGEHLGDRVPRVNDVGYYTERQVRTLRLGR